MSGGVLIELPWPPAKLSPNASHAGSWWIKRAAGSKYRDDCLVMLREQRVPRLFVDPPVMLELTFCPPTRRRFDLDNSLSRIKTGVDALAELMGVDDQIFEYTLRRGEPTKGGKVLVRLHLPEVAVAA